jgi:hypothetical protein
MLPLMATPAGLTVTKLPPHFSVTPDGLLISIGEPASILIELPALMWMLAPD